MQIPEEEQDLFPDFPLGADKNVREELNYFSWGNFPIYYNICKVKKSEFVYIVEAFEMFIELIRFWLFPPGLLLGVREEVLLKLKI